MSLSYGKRPAAGFKEEDNTAKSLRQQGKKVKQMPRNEKYDMRVGNQKVEVKAAKKTKYKGSNGYPVEGYVFSNMKKNPANDKYILKCMSPDRSSVQKTYEIPSSEVKQRTLTITEDGKYEKFRKKANLKLVARKTKYNVLGSVIGAAVLAGPKTSLNVVKGVSGLDYSEESVNFGSVVRAVAGAAIGRSIANNIEQKTRKENEFSRSSQRSHSPYRANANRGRGNNSYYV